MAASRMPKIGCAGWSIPSRYATHFGLGDSLLARYATRFDVVEINSSFYRPHQRTTYARWAATVPAHFRFSVKLPRTLSHDSGLVGVGPLLDRFLDEVGGLGRPWAPCCCSCRHRWSWTRAAPGAFSARCVDAPRCLWSASPAMPAGSARRPMRCCSATRFPAPQWIQHALPPPRFQAARRAGTTGAGTVRRACITAITPIPHWPNWRHRSRSSPDRRRRRG